MAGCCRLKASSFVRTIDRRCCSSVIDAAGMDDLLVAQAVWANLVHVASQLRLNSTNTTRGRAQHTVSSFSRRSVLGCANITDVDELAVGRRVAQARDVADITQDGLARAVGLDRTAIKHLESGERKLDVTELAAIAQVLGRHLSFFAQPPAPAVVSRRADAGCSTALRAPSTSSWISSPGMYGLSLRWARSARWPAPGDTPLRTRFAPNKWPKASVRVSAWTSARNMRRCET